MIDQIHHLLEEAFREGSLRLFLLMYAGGVLAALTPCTYPMLPITVGYIGNQAGGKRGKAFTLSLSLVTGLAAVYAVLGGVVAAAGGTFGSLMGNGWALYLIALFFLMMGLFLLDVFHFPTPQFFSGLQTAWADRGGILGAFLVGAVSGLIICPCTGPILAVALGAMALTLKNMHGMEYLLQIAKSGILLFLFGFGQGTLILLAGIFTGFLAKLPRAGAWMEGIKKGFALLTIVSASFLFVFVGQNTDFPSLTQILAGSKPDAAPSSEPPAAESRPREILLPSAIRAPDFTLSSLGKGRVTLSHFKGKKGVVLVFFATWCVSCVKEVPEIKQFAEMAQKENITVLAINYKQPAELVERFKETHQIDYGILLDTEGTVTTGKYGITGLPHHVGIDAKGGIIYRGTALPDNKDEFIKKLKQGS